MRRLYVPVRLVVAVLTAAAASGCVHVGDDAGPRRAPHSAAQREGADSGGGPVSRGGGVEADDEDEGDGKHGRGGKKKKHGESASASADEREPREGSAAPSKPGQTVRPGEPVPTGEPTPPPVTSAPPEPPASTPPPPDTEPPSAEPSSSAHEDPAPQLGGRAPM
ncbi:hypothetical protein [Streptomyces sp. NBC_01171]|uniref:hypothetical protein n=1 Tax=Streptomyces sp. NBC_01171 TaxID=2903757 RepID=UPI0038696EB4|nr:hypothetical protein OG448_16245 [Streptomyces sp. NBC_01171]